ncbi:MAG: hypothetical protein A2V65_09235 [Deltaproteobacteria bacterium RBG_13_49_15]|nr:MAG: hypothetical protein A2V65_09235 [Deltaproteobacteria bacterium RBG_13_49_15]
MLSESHGFESITFRDIRQAAQKAHRYLSTFSADHIGLNFDAASYSYRNEYPKSSTLGNTGLAAEMLGALCKAEKTFWLSDTERSNRLRKYLISKMKPDGTWSFDDFNTSNDLDTTLRIALTLLESGVCPRFFDNLIKRMEAFRCGEGFGSFSQSKLNSNHSNFGAHIEATANAMLLLKYLSKCENGRCDRLADWLTSRQSLLGDWELYWYPSPYQGIYMVLKVAGTDGVHGRKALDFTLSSQHADGSWASSEATRIIDTTYALRTLALFHQKGRPLKKGLSFLMDAQQASGRWPGNRVFAYYYPNTPGKESPEWWHDRRTGLFTTSLALSALSEVYILF